MIDKEMKFLKLTYKDQYVVVQLNRKTANTLEAVLVGELRYTFKALEEDQNVKGVILAGSEKFFSAGLDVIELYDYDKLKISNFFTEFSQLHVQLANFKKPFICAITGYCPAGGTVLAITADYRVMADDPKYSIGLNEVAVNVNISPNLIANYSFWLGKSLANRFVLDGKLLNPQEALKYNLIDEVCDASEVLKIAEKQMHKYLKADENIFINAKSYLRMDLLKSLNHDPKELEKTLDVWWDPKVRLKMKALVDSLSSKKN
jgi:3,2-trans-enoyl-CoA isomerase